MMLSLSLFHPLKILVAAAVVACVASCGGGDNLASGGVGSGGTGSAAGNTLGIVQGFGSVIIDGQRIDDSQAAVEFESEPGNSNKPGVDNPTTRLGQRVIIDSDAAATVATRIRILPEVIGSAESMDITNNRLVVAGQSVRLNTDGRQGAATVLEGLDSLTDVSVGDRLEVHGLSGLDASTGERYVQATRIERALVGADFVRVSGVVSSVVSSVVGALSPVTSSLRLGSLTVTFTATTRLLTEGGDIAIGKRVVVWSAMPVKAGVLAAQVIATSNANHAGKALRIGALVTDCASPGACAARLSIGGVSADASSTNFINGTAADLRNGIFVRAVGTVDDSGVFKVRTLAYRLAAEPDVTLYGVVARYVSNKNFSVRGIQITTNAATRIDSRCSLAESLAVQVSGTSKSGALLASSITCLGSQ
jgi:hypothetical protein